jgi:hypothetical protein
MAVSMEDLEIVRDDRGKGRQDLIPKAELKVYPIKLSASPNAVLRLTFDGRIDTAANLQKQKLKVPELLDRRPLRNGTSDVPHRNPIA